MTICALSRFSGVTWKRKDSEKAASLDPEEEEESEDVEGLGEALRDQRSEIKNNDQRSKINHSLDVGAARARVDRGLLLF